MSNFKHFIDFIRDQFPNNTYIPLHEPRFIGNDRKYVLDAIDSTFVSSVGQYVDRFEKMMCEITGARYAVAVVNGTAALHVALLLTGVEREDEVITQGLSFIATVNAITYCGASPIFLDVDKQSMGLSVESVRKFLEKNTRQENGNCINVNTGKRIKAVVPMHTFGHPMQIDDMVSLCSAHSIPVIEDAAESLGSYYKGQHTGTFGRLGAFSFNGNKTVTCGGGGAIVTNNKELAVKAKHITTTAKIPHSWEYVHDSIGFNYRMPNLNAALACAQLENLENFVASKRNLAKLYAEFCKSYNLDFVMEQNECKSNYWLNAIRLTDRNERNSCLQELNDSGVMCRPIWTLLFKMPMFAQCYRDEQENAQWLEDRVVNFPSSVRV